MSDVFALTLSFYSVLVTFNVLPEQGECNLMMMEPWWMNSFIFTKPDSAGGRSGQNRLS